MLTTDQSLSKPMLTINSILLTTIPFILMESILKLVFMIDLVMLQANSSCTSVGHFCVTLCTLTMFVIIIIEESSSYDQAFVKICGLQTSTVLSKRFYKTILDNVTHCLKE